MADRFSSLIPNDNMYVIKTAADLPQNVDRWRIYHLLYDPGAGAGLYYSPDAINLVRLASGGATIPAGTVDNSILRWDAGGGVWVEFTSFILPLVDGTVDQIMQTDGLGVVTWVDIPPAGIIIQDEGTPLATSADTLDFIGLGVTASGVGATKDITVLDQQVTSMFLSGLLSTIINLTQDIGPNIQVDIGPAFGLNVLQVIYLNDPSVPQIVTSAGLPMTFQPTIATDDVFALRDSAGDDIFRVAAGVQDTVDIGLGGQRTWSFLPGIAGRSGSQKFLPDNFTQTVSPIGAALQWDSTITSAIPGGGGLGNEVAPAMVAAIGELILTEQGFAFSTSLLFNQAIKISCAAGNSGPLYTMVNQPNLRSTTAGNKVGTQANAVRSQMGVGPNIAGNITLASHEPFYAFLTVNATVGTAAVTLVNYFAAKQPNLVAGGTIGTLNVMDIPNILPGGIGTLRGINSAMNSGTFINHTGVAVSTFGGDIAAPTFNSVPLTTAGVATNYLDETGVYSVPPSGLPVGTTEGAGLFWDVGNVAWEERPTLTYLLNTDITGAGTFGNELQIFNSLQDYMGLTFQGPISNAHIYYRESTDTLTVQSQVYENTSPTVRVTNTFRVGAAADDLQITTSGGGTSMRLITSVTASRDLEVLASNGTKDLHLSFGTGLLIDEKGAPHSQNAGEGQFWIRNDVPNVPMFTDDIGTSYNLLETSGGASIVAEYRFSTTLTAADPGSGNFRMNNATPASVTEVYISGTTNANVDLNNILGFIQSGDRIYLQQDNDSGRYILFDVTANVDNGGWFTLTGTVSNSGVLFANVAKCHILILFGASTTGVTSVAGGTNINVTGTAAAPIVNLDAAIIGVSVNGVTLSAVGVATNYLDETGNYSVPPGAGVTSFDGRVGAVLPISADYDAFYLVKTGGAQTCTSDVTINGGGSLFIDDSFTNFRLLNSTDLFMESAGGTEDFRISMSASLVQFTGSGFAPPDLSLQIQNWVGLDINVQTYFQTPVTIGGNSNPGSGASWNAPHGAVPSTPLDGDFWTTTLGAFCRINGVTVNLAGAGGAFGDLPDGIFDNAALKWDDGGQVWETAAGRLQFDTDTGAQTSIITSDSVLILNASSQVRIDPAVTTFYAEYTTNNSFISFEGAGFKHIQTGVSGGDLVITAGNGGSNLVLSAGSVLAIAEAAAPNADVLTRGQIWIDSADNLPYYRNEVGTDFPMAAVGTGDVVQGGVPVSSSLGVWATPPTLEGTDTLRWASNTLTILDSILTGSAAFMHDQVDFNTTFVGTADWNITGITAIAAGTVDADFDAITGTTFNGVALTTGGVATNYLDETGAYSVPVGSGGTPAGVDEQVQWNDAGAFGADGSLVWNGTRLLVGDAGVGGVLLDLRDGNTTGSGAAASIAFTDQLGTVQASIGTTIIVNSLGIVSGAGGIIIDAAQILQLSGSQIRNLEPITMLERAAPIASVALYGQLWCRDDVGNTLVFTNDAGDELALNPFYVGIQETSAIAAQAAEGRFWVVDDTPNMPMYQNDSDQNYNINLLSEYRYEFDSSTVSADPGQDQFRLNNATLASVTAIFFNNVVNATYGLQTQIFSKLQAGDVITIYEFSNPADHIRCRVVSVVDNTGWYTINVQVIDSAGSFGNGNPYIVQFEFNDEGISIINVQNGNYTLLASDKGKTIHKVSGGAGETYTIPSNASVPYDVGTLIAMDNQGGGTLSIAITTDTMQATDGSTGTQVLSDDGRAMVQKMTATTWRYMSSDL